MRRHTPPSPNTKLVTAKAAAAELGIPYTTLRDLHFRGKLQILRVGRAWYFDRDDLDNWIRTNKENAPSHAREDVEELAVEPNAELLESTGHDSHIG